MRARVTRRLDAMSGAFDADDCRTETFWHAGLEMWAMRVRHVPTGVEIVRYAGHDRPCEPFVREALPGALKDLRWLVAHRGPDGPSSGRIALDSCVPEAE